jgi:hypothetical protein
MLLFASFSSVFSVPSVRTLFFKTCTKAYRAVAKRRGAYAAMLRSRTPDFIGYRGVTSGLTSGVHEVLRSYLW